MLEGLPGMATAEGHPSFLSALSHLMTTPICEWLARSKRCCKSLRCQIFLPVMKTQCGGRAFSKRSQSNLVVLLQSPNPSNRATQFRATYITFSSHLLSNNLCSLGLGQVDSAIPDLKLVLFQSVLDHCFRGFYLMQL